MTEKINEVCEKTVICEKTHELETLLVKSIFHEKSARDDFFTSEINFNKQSLKNIVTKYFERYMPNVLVSKLDFVINFDAFDGALVYLEPKREVQVIRPEEANPENQALATQVRFEARYRITSKNLYDMVRLHVLETMPEVSVLNIEPKLDGESKHIFHLGFMKKLGLDRLVVEIATHR